MPKVNVLQYTAHTLIGILRQYLHAPLFFVLHACVLIYFLRRAWPIHQETVACDRWTPGIQETADTSSELIRQLELFRTEADRWAKRGLLMPMTDISDRLDSMIEGWTDRLHSIANLFMIVGIAGTFFSMVLLANAGTEDIQTVFREALANALPVGFVGLILTLVFYPLSGWLQSGLERAAAGATRKAIEDRGRRDFASTETLLNAFQAVSKLPDTLANSLEPLAQLQQTLDTTLTRVMQGLDQNWAETSAKLQQKVEIVAGNVSSLGSVADTISKSLQTMSSTLHETSTGVAEMQRLTTTGAEQIGLLAKQSSELHQNVKASSEALGEAANQIAQYGEIAQKELANAFKDVATQCAPAWEKLSDSFVRDLSNFAAQQMQGIGSSADLAGKKLEDAAGKLELVASTLSDAVTRAIREGIAELKDPILKFDESFRQNYPELLNDLRNTLANAAKERDKVRDLINQSDRASGNVQQLEKSWQRLVENVARSTDTLDRAARDLETALDRLNDIEGHWLAVRLFRTQYKVAAGGK